LSAAATSALVLRGRGMSSKQFTRQTFDWLRQINNDPKLSPTNVRVLLMLATEYFNEDAGGAAWPGYATLATKLGISKQTVIDSVHLAHQRGHLRVEWGRPGRKQSNHYWMIVNAPKGPSGRPFRGRKRSNH
jgi:Helix-turn-helix domain